MKCVITVFLLMFLLNSSCDDLLGEYDIWYPNLDDYRFLPKLGNCYEIYNQSENVSPLICQRPSNPDKHSCIYLTKRENYCLELQTPTNETIQLLCENSERMLLSYHGNYELANCFNVTQPAKNKTEVCQQKFGNYSIGITTRDNFTILFDSYFCSTSMNNEDRQIYKNFFHAFSFDPETRSCYKIYNNYQKISPYTCLNKNVFSSCIKVIPQKKNCEGIITQNNETVILHCRDSPLLSPRNNCFKIYTEDNHLHVSCKKRVEERCIGITTPSNLIVLLECYFCSKPNIEYKFYNVEKQRKRRKFVKTYLDDEYLKKHSYLGTIEFKTFKENLSNVVQDVITSTAYEFWLPNSSCYGITLESNETVILGCISNETLEYVRPGCYSVFNSTTDPKEEDIACVKILNEDCVGITTPKNWSIKFACYSEYKHNSSRLQQLKEKYKEDPVESYKIFPGLDNCYEIYSSHEINSYSCTKSAKPENYSCINWIPEKQHCLGLKTPSNETIEFVCGNSPEDVTSYNTFSNIKNCFNVHSSDNKTNVVCQQKFGDYSVGLTTPHNNSILFDSFFCPTYKNPYEIQNYKDFIGNFTFDPKIRSCYKIFTPDQEVSPYTCLNRDVYDACIHPIENSSCMGIQTQNNETILIECMDDTIAVNETGCFKIYTSDNKLHAICHKQIEERCIGIITPSNLTVLLECTTCKSLRGGTDLPVYTDEYRQIYRPYIDYAIYTFNNYDHPLENKTSISVYSPEQDILLIDCFGEVKNYNIHVLHGHDNCRGITLHNLETIVLECPHKKIKKLGCYDVYSPLYNESKVISGPDQKVANVCVTILNEWCVGITTPKNWTIPLGCFQPPQAACSVLSMSSNSPPGKV